MLFFFLYIELDNRKQKRGYSLEVVITVKHRDVARVWRLVSFFQGFLKSKLEITRACLPALT